jgi:uncharacterized protein (TIGR02594 family)
MKSVPWLERAQFYIGTKEIPGPKHNARIMKWWGLIRAQFTDDETPWCAGFVGGVLEELGIRSTRSASSLSYLAYGQPLTEAIPGAIAVKRRKGGGHVTFVAGSDGKGGLWCVGGNQSDAVTMALYPASVFEAFRWPSSIPVIHQPLVRLASGPQAIPKEA